MKMLNIGCGTSYHPDWINIDLKPHSEDVICHDLTRKLPFKSRIFDACYSSHILEHFNSNDADFLIQEQKRVLKKKGIIRIVVPDLEVICKNYLQYLNELKQGNFNHEFRYDYSLLELYDQTTRITKGGELGKLWRAGSISDDNLEYIIYRNGKEAEKNIRQLQKPKEAIVRQPRKTLGKLSLKKTIRKLIKHTKRKTAETIISRLYGMKAVEAFREGLFRRSGEIHYVMYDEYRLKRLLRSHNFENIKVCRSDESKIPNFNTYQLDNINGEIRKPDSLFMEANRK